MTLVSSPSCICIILACGRPVFLYLEICWKYSKNFKLFFVNSLFHLILLLLWRGCGFMYFWSFFFCSVLHTTTLYWYHFSRCSIIKRSSQNGLWLSSNLDSFVYMKIAVLQEYVNMMNLFKLILWIFMIMKRSSHNGLWISSNCGLWLCLGWSCLVVALKP